MYHDAQRGVLHTIAIFAIMIPAFVVISLGDFLLAVSTITAVHGVLGLTAEVLGLWLVVSWRLRSSLRYCAPKKKVDVADVDFVVCCVNYGCCGLPALLHAFATFAMKKKL